MDASGTMQGWAWAWAQALAVPLAMLVDWRWGEPPARVHPVVWMGRYLGRVGPGLCARPPAQALVGGATAWLLGAGASLALGIALVWVVQVGLPSWTEPVSSGMTGQGDALTVHAAGEFALALVQAVLLALVLKPCLSWRMLHDEVAAVEQGLSSSLAEGRERLSRLVSREVQTLDEEAVRESALESLAENLNDSVVAPLFWFCVAGLPGAVVYRFANTADAMWGYRGRYEWAGKWAARADDLLSWLPARVTALLLCLASWQWPGWSALRRQAGATPSPNGGWPMGALALVLGVRLRKPGVYGLNGNCPSPCPPDTVRALHITRRAVGCAALGMALLVAAAGGLAPDTGAARLWHALGGAQGGRP